MKDRVEHHVWEHTFGLIVVVLGPAIVFPGSWKCLVLATGETGRYPPGLVDEWQIHPDCGWSLLA